MSHRSKSRQRSPNQLAGLKGEEVKAVETEERERENEKEGRTKKPLGCLGMTQV